MGGYGSGRYPDTYNYTVEDCLTIDINWLKRKGHIKAGYSSSGILTWSRNGNVTSSLALTTHLDADPPYICLLYTWNKTEKRDYRVFLATTRPYYGGTRYWFHCPNCGKRVGKLHNAPGSGSFLCRTCQNLTYTSCRESHQLDTIIAYLSVDTGLSPKEVRKALRSIRSGKVE